MTEYECSCAKIQEADHRRHFKGCALREPLPSVGIKHDTGKPRFDLVPWSAVRAIVDVLTWGAAKYDEHNWRLVRPFRARFLAAAFRHLAAYADGEENDPESGLPHLAHVGCNVLFLLAGPSDPPDVVP